MSTADALQRYLADRIATPRVMLLYAMMSLASLSWSDAAHVNAMRLAALALLIVSFRLWDDIADMPYDRTHRAVPSDSDKRSLVRLLAVTLVAIGAAMLAWRGALHATLYLGLCTVLGCAYAVLPSTWRRTRAVVVPIKYPVFFALLESQPHRSWRWLACGGVAWLVIALMDWPANPQRAS